MPTGWAITVVVLCVAVVALAVVVLGLARQVAPVLERAVNSAGGDLRWLGPRVGDELPNFAVPGDDGEVTGADLRGRPVVLLFLSSGCGPCTALAGEMNRTELGDLAGQLVVVTSPEGPQELGIPAGLRVLLERDREVSDPLSVISTPFAVAVDSEGIVKAARVANTKEDLDDLAAVLVS